MNTKLVCVLAAILIGQGSAWALEWYPPLNAIGPATFSEMNTGQTYSGMGMVTMLDTIGPVIGPNADYFDQRFMLTNPYARNIIQHDLSSLLDKRIRQVMLSIRPGLGWLTTTGEYLSLLDQDRLAIVVESFDTDGTVSGADFAGGVLGSVTGEVHMGTQYVDITPLVLERVRNDKSWLGLRVYATGPGSYGRPDVSFWGYTLNPPNMESTATVRLITATPDTGGTLALVTMGLVAIGSLFHFRFLSRSAVVR